jgi:hypothetical protein
VALITAAEARSYIRGLSGTSEDTLLGTLIDRTGALFARYCAFPAATDGGVPTIEQATYTRYLNSPGGNTLQLDVRPVLSVSSLHDSIDRTYASADLVAASDYDLYGEDGIVVLKTTADYSQFSTAYRAIKVVYSAGYATVPEDIKHAACLQVKWFYEGRDIVGLRNISQTGGNATVVDGALSLLTEVKEALRPYRLPSAWIG